MSSKYAEILEEARKKFEEILEEFEKQEDRGEPMKPDSFDVSKLAELLLNVSKREVQEKEPTIQLNILHSDFEILINLLADKIKFLPFNPLAPFNDKNFEKLVNLFRYMYFNENYNESEKIEEVMHKLINLSKSTFRNGFF